ncbi:MAG: C69 family dipeptidase [Bacteroidales bacterium]|jgi:dipeptidase|nr:C69 family dipeptidase [Bacteroidales bacterium]
MRNTIKAPLILATLLFPIASWACTNILVTKGASATGSTMISYAADSHTLYGELYHWPAATYPEGTMLQINEWDTNKPLGEIAQAVETYNVVGNINEYQVAIGETTYGGHKELVDTTGIMDYGSLIYVALQRAKTARGAIKIMTDLVAEYGYYSSGESFSIADPSEVWILEMIGKGGKSKGAVWVAQRIPDGYVSGHANQARITTIDFKDKENFIYAKDVVSFAEEMGYFSGKKKDFSFSDAYAPLDFGGQRFCEARVWAFYNIVNPEEAAQYLDYAMGHADNRMPLYFKAKNKLTHRDVQNVMRDHYENTPMDMTQDAGAGPYQVPYRWRGLTWEVDSVTYCNERAIATQQTGFSFVAEMRDWMPQGLGILWFGVDDAATSVYMPMYCGITEIPNSVKVGNGDMMNFSWTSNFWMFNWVANQAYAKYSYMTQDILPLQTQLEDSFDAQQKNMEEKALAVFEDDNDKAITILNDYSTKQAKKTLKTWKALGEYLMVKYMDGNVKKEENGQFKQNAYGLQEFPDQPGYSERTYREIVKDNGEVLKVIGDGH